LGPTSKKKEGRGEEGNRREQRRGRGEEKRKVGAYVVRCEQVADIT